MSIITIIVATLLSVFISAMSYEHLDKNIKKKFNKTRYTDMSIPVSIVYTFLPLLLFIDYLFVMYIVGFMQNYKLTKLKDLNDAIRITKVDYKEELEMNQFGDMVNVKKCYLNYRYVDENLHFAFGNKDITLVGDICDNFKNVKQQVNTTETKLRLLYLNKNMENMTKEHNDIVSNLSNDNPNKSLEDFSSTLDMTIGMEQEKMKVKRN